MEEEKGKGGGEGGGREGERKRGREGGREGGREEEVGKGCMCLTMCVERE